MARSFAQQRLRARRHAAREFLVHLVDAGFALLRLVDLGGLALRVRYFGGRCAPDFLERALRHRGRDLEVCGCEVGRWRRREDGEFVVGNFSGVVVTEVSPW